MVFNTCFHHRWILILPTKSQSWSMQWDKWVSWLCVIFCMMDVSHRITLLEAGDGYLVHGLASHCQLFNRTTQGWLNNQWWLCKRTTQGWLNNQWRLCKRTTQGWLNNQWRLCKRTTQGGLNNQWRLCKRTTQGWLNNQWWLFNRTTQGWLNSRWWVFLFLLNIHCNVLA